MLKICIIAKLMTESRVKMKKVRSSEKSPIIASPRPPLSNSIGERTDTMISLTAAPAKTTMASARRRQRRAVAP